MTTEKSKFQDKFRTEKITVLNNVISVKYNESLDVFLHKDQYPWHLKMIIETRFLFSNARIIEQEEILQSEINKDLRQILSKYCKIKQVVVIEKKALKELHWYLSSVDIDYLKMKAVIDEIKYKRFIWFYLSYDERWDNIQTYSNHQY